VECRFADIGTFRDGGAYLLMARDCWVENLRCPWCRKTGIAQLSATDEYSWDVQVDGISEGFRFMQLGNVSNFFCSLCDSPVEP
jgi:hypothetical protein